MQSDAATHDDPERARPRVALRTSAAQKIRSLGASLLRLVYPSQCLMCSSLVETDFALCGPCWRQTHFLMGLVCNGCGAPLPGEDDADVLCDDCIRVARPWSRGRACVLYQDHGRRVVLSLKHGDRDDLAAPVARWMARTAAPLITGTTLLVPVPLHWRRLLKRRYNQSAMLANALSPLIDRPVAVDALVRPRATPSLAHKSSDERFITLEGAIAPHPSRGRTMTGRDVLLIDDVMTSGATLAACAVAARAAGAHDVCVLTLARAAKAP